MPGCVEKDLSGWGNYPVQRCHVMRPQSFVAMQEAVVDGKHRSCISRGLGRSYGDAALNENEGVILSSELHRFLDFDAENGVLECETGVSLSDIINVFLPRGWFLQTTPGTKYVTVGGAIAADVHGKNHHKDGSFGNCVLSFDLMTPTGEILKCSPSQNENVFWATVGGMGLTGIVLSARIQLKKVESAYCNVSYRRTANLDESLECFEATDQDYRYSVAWVDCLASGKRLGRSVVMLGNEASAAELPRRLRARPLHLPRKRKKSVPPIFPSFLLNSLSIRLFNSLFYAKHSDKHNFVDYNTYFYPLDAVSHWNRIYGKKGFIQYQALFPPETSRRGLIELLEVIARSRKASFLAVLKSSGQANRGMLSYLHSGHTLALDIKNTGEDLHCLVRELDEILLKHSGRLYLAKDAMTSPENFLCMYDQIEDFREVKRKMDPDNRFVSSQALRLKIVELT